MSIITCTYCARPSPWEGRLPPNWTARHICQSFDSTWMLTNGIHRARVSRQDRPQLSNGYPPASRMGLVQVPAGHFPAGNAARSVQGFTSMTITYHFPTIPAGQTLNTRKHWAERARLAAEAKEYAIALILRNRAGRPESRLNKVAMSVRFIIPTRRRIDWQSLYGRVKPYEDALVATGELTDDNIGVVQELTLTWQYRKGESGVTVTLTPLE